MDALDTVNTDSGSAITFDRLRDSDLEAWRAASSNEGQRFLGEVCVGSDVLVAVAVTRETFEFSAPETGTIIFDVRGIKDAMIAGELQFQMCEIEVAEMLYQHIVSKNGVDVEAVAKVTDERSRTPGIVLSWGVFGTHTVIDGNHRLVRRYENGDKRFRCALVQVDRNLLPFMCRPGDERQFLERENDACRVQASQEASEAYSS